MQMQRLFSELCLLLRRERVTCEEMARLYEVAPRTIYRDMDVLSGAGIPVYTQRGRGGGVALLPGFALPRTLLTEAEQGAVLAALQGAAAAGAEGASALDKLSALFARGEEEEHWLAVDFSPWGGDRAAQETFYLLKEAILGRRVLAFRYYSARGEATQREVEPRQLVFKGQAWYLWAWCRKREDWRFFKLLRMEGVRDTGEPFSPPPSPARTGRGGAGRLRPPRLPAAAVCPLGRLPPGGGVRPLPAAAAGRRQRGGGAGFPRGGVAVQLPPLLWGGVSGGVPRPGA